MGDIYAQEIERICEMYVEKIEKFYIGANIPIKKLRNAIERCRIPLHEKIILFVDSTVFGSGKKGVAIASNGLYWSNFSSKGCMLWNEFSQVEFHLKNTCDVDLGEGKVIALNPGSNKDQIFIQFLQQIQTYVRSRLSWHTTGVLEVDLPGESLLSTHESYATSAKGINTVLAQEVVAPAEESAEWMIAIGTNGPYTASTIKAMLAANYIKPLDTLVWKPGMASWVPLVEEPTLAVLPNVPQSAAAEPGPDAAEGVLEQAASAESSASDGRLDVNTVPFEKLLELPHIGAAEATRLRERREASGGFATVEEIGGLLGLKPHQVEQLRPRVTFGSPAHKGRLNLNHATEEELAALPGVGSILAKKAIAARAARGQFDAVEEFFAALELKPHAIERIRPLVCVSALPPPPKRGVRVVDF